MGLQRSIAAALQASSVPFHTHEPLAKKTWWRAGGSADVFVDVRSLDMLKRVSEVAAKHHAPIFVLGNASNLLVADAGIRGIVVRLSGELAEVGPETNNMVQAGAGVKLVRWVRKMPKVGLTGLEFLAGIPGTVGGAVRMNAGTRLGEVKDALVDVGLVMPGGGVAVRSLEQLQLTYRSSVWPEDAVAAWARFRTGTRSAEESAALIEEHLAYRARTQPVNVPTCGSTFRNPPGDYAGRLIEAAGLKGAKVGPAVVSEKHANFIVNTGGARAADLRHLIEHVQVKVFEKFRVHLEPEVHYAGDWGLWDPESTW